MKQQNILVVGSSGTVGSEIVRILKEQGHQVRETTSRAAAVNASRVHLDLGTGQGLHEAFEGIDRAFFLSPPGHADMHRTLSPLVQEAKRRGLAKVVLMTALGANASDSTPFRKVELELERSGLTYNIIRPNWFMQNFHTFWVQGIQQARQIGLPAGTAATSFIDTLDVSAVAAKLLVDDSLANQALDLTGPAALTHTQVAEQISKAIGTPVEYRDIAPETLRSQLISAGLPADYVGFLIAIFGFLREGYNAGLTDNVRKVLGREPADFASYAARQKKSWI